MKNPFKSTKFLVWFIFVAAMAFGLVMNQMLIQNSLCVNDPFVYGAIRLEEAGSPLMCVCDFNLEQYSGYSSFTFDENGMKDLEGNDNIFGNLTIVPIEDK